MDTKRASFVKNRLLIPGIILFVLVAGFLSGILFSDIVLFGRSPDILLVHQKGYRFTNPLLDYELGEKMFSHELGKFKGAIENYLGDLKSNTNIVKISVYFRDLNNGPWFGINEKEKFSPASLLKVPLMITILKAAEAEPGLLYKKVQFLTNGLDYSYVYNPKEPLVSGQYYTIENLIYRMIVYSDNVAKDLLQSVINIDETFTFYNELGLNISQEERMEDNMIVKDYAAFFRILFNSTYLKRKFSESALELLTLSDFKDGLVAGVPSGVAVAHKFGERSYVDSDIKQLHDCGIVYYPDHPYLLAIMTRGYRFEDLASSISNISSIVYHEVDSRHKKKPD